MKKIIAIIFFPLLAFAGSPSLQQCITNSDADTALATTVQDTSASGQPNLYIAAVTNISAGDVLVVAGTTPARKEVCTVSSVHSAIDEVQTVTFSPTPNSGAYTITFSGQTTGSLNYNDNAATVQAAFRALSNISDSSTVTGSVAAGLVFGFLGADGGIDQPLMTQGSNTLAELIAEQDTITFSATPDAGTWTITMSGQTTSSLAFDADASAVQTAIRALSNVGNSSTVTGDYSTGFVFTAIGSDVGTDYAVSVDDSSLETDIVATITEDTKGATNATTITVTETTKGHASYPVCASNLTYSHTSVQADPVHSTNRIGPLTVNFEYDIYCYDSSSVLIACRCALGGEAVDANATTDTGKKWGLLVPALNSVEWTVPTSDYRYLSCIPFANNSLVDACPKN